MVRATLMGLLASVMFGQSFEVASIKLHEGPMYRIGITTSGPRLTADAANVQGLVVFAYNVKGFQVTGDAPLLKQAEARWDIVAKAEGDSAPTRAEFQPMMQALLADRFQLKVHREMREMPVFAWC
jgi:uncharacterized protein (TIGR03435 family)